ncbi:hypothetical protein H6G33_15080 [Calothrix sp. FACHB-1219]|uniref:hypothetical protein n=1 Tax=unclassified Calothrix TaxID=2619626 RepID=UPI001688C4FC|nr:MULTISPECIES: hypothetical protein [unclassified Calothrix]MBD2203856.1 hypothetical protein [Calothrix sp. FACHB-168]MBD2218358.1 hypothetical protein [Calothrix sp. FACHB-1219]
MRQMVGHGIAHRCQLKAKPAYRKELKFLANSKSHLKMTKYPQNLESTLVDLGY